MLPAVVLVLLLTGCGGAADTSSSVPATPDEPVSTSAASSTSATAGSGPRLAPPVDQPDATPGTQAGAMRPVEPEVVERLPHDPSAFTQGLVLSGGALYESTGLYGSSTLREVDVSTGTVRRQVDLDDQHFGEGLAAVGSRLVQLTWQEGIATVYEASTFEVVDRFRYQGEGWGLCHDGTHLWMSDGSSVLTRRDPGSFEVVDSIEVTRDGAPVERLNELECPEGEILANVWLTDEIVAVDPTTGEVTRVVDASGLLDAGSRSRLEDGAVLNGIAHDPVDGTLLLTGKLWPHLYRVTLPG